MSSSTRLKIIDGDTAEIVENKVNHFIETYVYAVERLSVFPKKVVEEDGSTDYKGYYCYITYKKLYKKEDRDNGEEKDD